MKKKIVLTLAAFLSIGVLDASPRHRMPRMSVLEYAAQLDTYTKMSTTQLLDKNKAIEAWDIIGRLYNALSAEKKGANTKSAHLIAEKIKAYKKRERAALAERQKQSQKK